MQAQVLAYGGPADARAQEQRGRGDGPAGHYDGRGANRELGGRGAISRRLGSPLSLNPDRATSLREHSRRGGPYQDLRAVLPGVHEICLRGRLLRGRGIAETHVGGGLGRVTLGVGVAGDEAEVVPEPLASFPQTQVRAVQIRAVPVHLNALEDRVEVAIELRLGEVAEPMLARPLGANVIERA